MEKDDTLCKCWKRYGLYSRAKHRKRSPCRSEVVLKMWNSKLLLIFPSLNPFDQGKTERKLAMILTTIEIQILRYTNHVFGQLEFILANN